MRKISFVIFMAVLVLLFIAGSLQIYASRKAEEKTKEILSALGLEERARYKSVSYSLLKGTTEVEGLEVRTESGKLWAKKLFITKLTDTDLELRLERVRGDDRNFEEFEKNMKELGYRDVYLNTSLSVSLYEKEKRLFLREFSVEVPSAFNVSLGFDLLGVDRKLIKELSELEEDDREAVNELAQRLKDVSLASFRLEFEDRGFLERVIEREASRKGKRPEEVRKEILNQLRALEKGGEFERSLFKSLKDLLEEGGTLKIVANPQKPVSFEDLVVYSLMGLQSRDFSRLLRVLNLRAEHSKM